jgi:hypothetical protein
MPLKVHSCSITEFTDNKMAKWLKCQKIQKFGLKTTSDLKEDSNEQMKEVRKSRSKLESVAHACNPNYLGG